MRRKAIFIYLALVSYFFVPFAGAQNNNIVAYSLKNLLAYQYKTSPITIQSLAFKNELQHAYNVTFSSMNLTVSGRLSIPAVPPAEIKGIIIMLRGHQRPNGYYTGKGTENPAKRYLESGWAVIAPDFFGYGASSPAPPPFSMHQFYSTVNAVELYKSLEQPDFRFASAVPQADRIALPGAFRKIVLWGHSNGGQVAIHFLEIIQKPVTTVLWAPVSLAYPESAGHFGHGAAWLERFKNDYTAADYSLYNYLDKIAPGTRILLEQGDRDTAVPKAWNDTFSKAVEEENHRRDRAGIGKINLRYEVYRNADHNLNPYWTTILPGNVRFWEQ